MRKLILLTALFSLLYAASAHAMITMSRHNLSSSHVEVTESTPYADVYTTTGTSEVCVFCHTPHGGTTDAPLWNRQMATSGSYTPYSSSTIDTGGGAIPQPDGISLACLSCHDGTIAIDSLRNATGSGNFDSTPATQGWTFNGGLVSNTLPEGAGDRWITNLTQNLSDDHPISMLYPTATEDPKFNTPGGSSTTAQWFEETGGIAGRADDNEVKLYGAAGARKVQCASCHNPHGTTAAGGTPANQLAPNGVDYATFLRKSNSSSALCTTCHIK